MKRSVIGLTLVLSIGLVRSTAAAPAIGSNFLIAGPSCTATATAPAGQSVVKQASSLARGIPPSPVLRRAAVKQTSDEHGQVVFSSAFVEGQAYLKAEAEGITVERSTTEQGITLRVAASNDVIEFSVRLDGRAAIARKNRVRHFNAMSKLDDVRAVQTFTAGSAALQAFDALVGVLEDSERAEAISLLTSHALVSAMHGQSAPARMLAKKVLKLAARGSRPASMRSSHETGPRECWGEYERSVAQYANEYQTCYNSWWWNPFYISGCNFVWITKAELAWFWLLSCSGGVPIA